MQINRGSDVFDTLDVFIADLVLGKLDTMYES